jgi:hypothetical protein
VKFDRGKKYDGQSKQYCGSCGVLLDNPGLKI